MYRKHKLIVFLLFVCFISLSIGIGTVSAAGPSEIGSMNNTAATDTIITETTTSNDRNTVNEINTTTDTGYTTITTGTTTTSNTLPPTTDTDSLNSENTPNISETTPSTVLPDPKNMRTGISYTTIAAAVSAAIDGDTIYIESGTYNEHDIIIDKNLTLIGQDQINTIIDAQTLGRIFYIRGYTVTIQSLTLKNGKENNDFGGAIYNYFNSTLNVTNCNFTQNTANEGGAISNGYSTLTVTNSSFTQNTAKYDGGAISNVDGILTVTESTFTNNSANYGGAIHNYVSFDANIHSSRFQGNSANYGGSAIFSSEGAVNAENNWWGSNSDPSGQVSSEYGYVDVNPWLVLNLSASPNPLSSNSTSTITADLTRNSNGQNTLLNGHLPDGIPVIFTTNLGTLDSGGPLVIANTLNGKATATLNSDYVTGTAHITAQLENQTISTDINIMGPVTNTRTVKTYLTIQDAINDTTTINGDTLSIRPGTYNEYSINVNKSLTITGHNQTDTILNAQQQGRIFYIQPGYTVTIQNLTLKNGYLKGEDEATGGAIFNSGNLTLKNTTISNNSVSTQSGGGAIYNNGTLTITNSTLNNNTADVNEDLPTPIYMGIMGGAIFNRGTINITGSNFTQNHANFSGGAIENYGGTLNITDTSFTQNNTNVGGAINNSGTLNINSSSFTQNYANFSGGAIGNYGGTLNITDTNFTQNNSYVGGAITNSGTLNINGSNFTQNNASSAGGAIYSDDGILKVTSTNLIQNHADSYGSAIYIYQCDITSYLHFNRFTENTGSPAVYLEIGTINAENNWWGSNNGPSGQVSGDVTADPWLVLNLGASPNPTVSNSTTNLTADLTHNSDGTDTSPDGHLPDGIPVVFTTDLGTVGSSTVTKITVNGKATAILNTANVAGMAHITAHVDSQTAATKVNILGPITNTRTLASYFTLQEAINNPDTKNGDTLLISQGTYQEYNVTINKSLTITGLYPAGVVLDAQYLGRIFAIKPGNTVNLQNLILTHGLSTVNGGAIWNSGTLHIMDSIFTDNTADYGVGGAIYNLGNLLVIDSTFDSNTANYGGAIWNSNGYLTIYGSNFTGNVATYGGALYNTGNLTVTSTNFFYNMANVWGGAIENNSGNALIQFNRLLENTAMEGCAVYGASGKTNAENNWWGSNNNPTTTPCLIGGMVDADPWLVLSIIAHPDSIPTNGSSLITADLNHNSDGTETSLMGHVPDGIEVHFNTDLGTLNSYTEQLLNGQAQTTLTVDNDTGTAHLSAGVDLYSVNTTVDVSLERVLNTRTGKNYQTIQAAINDPQTQIGDTLTLNDGIYTENVLVNLPLTIRSLNSNPNLVIVQAADPNRPIFKITSGGSGSILQDLTITGSSGFAGVSLMGASSCELLENVISNNLYGVELVLGDFNLVSSNNLITYNVYGVIMFNSPDALITGNQIQNNNTGIYAFESNASIISNNIISSNSGYGVILDGSSDSSISINTISNNGCAGIFASNVWSSNYSNHNTITNNQINANGSDGVEFYGSNYNTVSSNTITGNTANGIIVNGAYFNQIINNNQISSNGGNGVLLENHSAHNLVNSNNLSSNLVGLYVLNDSSNTISGNIIQLNTSYGVVLDGSFMDSVSGNYIAWNGLDGVLASTLLSSSPTTQNTIYLNLIVSNGFNGVNFHSIDSNTLNSNTISYNIQYGVNLDTANNTTITNNDLRFNGIADRQEISSTGNYFNGNDPAP
jgi:parallel beta-helix repeat protein/predicted outer membrane repeat protein